MYSCYLYFFSLIFYFPHKNLYKTLFAMNVTFLARLWFQRNKNNNKVFITNRKSSSFMITFPYFHKFRTKSPKSKFLSVRYLDIYLNEYNNYSHNTVFSMSSIVGTKNPFGFFI